MKFRDTVFDNRPGNRPFGFETRTDWSNSGKDGTGDLVNQLAPEMLYNVLFRLNLPDLLNCMVVCKKWKILLSTQYFWQTYLQQTFHLEDETSKDKLTGMLHELTSEWYNGWGCSKVSGSQRCVLDPVPRRWKSGIIHPYESDIKFEGEGDYRKMFQALYWFDMIQHSVDKGAIVYHDCGKSGECPVDLFLFPWQQQQLPTAAQILDIFGFNPRFKYKAVARGNESRGFLGQREWDGNYLDIGFRSRFQPWFSKEFCDMLERVFSNGFVKIKLDFTGRREAFRPFPVLFVSQVTEGWCGGVLTGAWV